jgi:hypothetical protein
MDSSSHSEVEAFLQCERRHYYSYGEKLEGKVVSEALIRGIVGHSTLASYYQSLKDGYEKTPAMDMAIDVMYAETDKYADQLFDKDKFVTELGFLIQDYWDTYIDDYMEILEVEVLHTIQLTDTFQMPVKIDLLARIPGRGIVAIDFKFCYDFFNVDKLDLSPQLPKYMAALTELGIHVDGIMYDELRYRKTKDNEADHSLKFRRTPVIVTPNKVVTIMREQLMAGKRISQLKQLDLPDWESKILRNPQACMMCPFVSVCSADLDGKDSDLVRVSYYQPKIYR